MPKYLAKNYLNELLQSSQSTISCLLISEEIPQVELAAQQSLASSFISSHPWLQDVIEFSGLKFTENQVHEEVQRLPMSSSSSSSAIFGIFKREAEWCLSKSQFHRHSTGSFLAELTNCCTSITQPLADNSVDVENSPDDNTISQCLLEEILMDSFGKRRLPLASELVRRLKPAVVRDLLFGQTTSTVSETLLYKDGITSVDLFLKQQNTLDHCTELSIEEGDFSGMDSQNLVLEEPIILSCSGLGHPQQLLLPPLDEFQSVLLIEFRDEFSSGEAVLNVKELNSCATAAAAATEPEEELMKYVAPVEFLSKSPPENLQLAFITMNQMPDTATEPFVWLESPFLQRTVTVPCSCALNHGFLTQDIQDETIERLCESDCFLLSKVSGEEVLGELWQSEKCFDEVHLMVRECQRPESVVTADGLLKLTTVSSAVNTLSLTSEEIASQELDLAWDPLQASYGLMAAAEKNCQEPVVMSCANSVIDRSAVEAHMEPYESNGVQPQSPFIQFSQTEVFHHSNAQNVTEAGQFINHHLNNLSQKHQRPATSVMDSCSSSRSSNLYVSLQHLDPLDQFLMLRKATGSKGPAVTHRVQPIVVASPLVAVVQPCLNPAAIDLPASTHDLVPVNTASDASSDSLVPSSGRCSEEDESKNISNSSATTVINVPLTVPFENLLRLIEDAGRPFVALLIHYRILVDGQNFTSLQSDVMDFIVRQQQSNFSSARSDGDVELKMDLLRAAICIHCLVCAYEHLMHSCLSSAAELLSLMQARNQQILGSILDNVLQKLLLECVHHNKNGILHPKALEMCGIILQFYSSNSRGASESKILVILPCDSQDVTESLGHYLSEILSSVDGTKPVLVCSSVLPSDVDKRCSASYNCHLVANIHLTDKWPWTDYGLVIEYSFSLATTYKEKCVQVNVPFIGLQSTKEILSARNDERGGDDDDVLISRSCLRQISIVVSQNLTAKHNELIHLLEARYNVVVTDRDYESLNVSGYFEDVTVDGSTSLVIENLMELRSKQEMERLVMRVSGLKQKFLACWILVFSSNDRSTTASPDLYSSNIIINISKLQASFGVLAETDFKIKVIFCHSYDNMAMRVRQIASDTLSQKDSSNSNSQMKLVSSRPTTESTRDERFLLSFPSLNSVSAQMLLRTSSLKSLLTLSKSEVQEMCHLLSNKIIQAFLEFRESVGEIFVILKQAHRSTGQSLSWNVSKSNEDSSSKNPLLLPHNTRAGFQMTGSYLIEEVDKEKDVREDIFKTHCLSSPRLKEFHKAEMLGSNFAAFISGLQNNLLDEMRLEPENKQKERLTDHSPHDEVYHVDLVPPVYDRSLETDRQLSFGFTNSGESVRCHFMLRPSDESKWTTDRLCLGDLADSSKTVAADANLMTCCSVGSTVLASNAMHFRTITDRNPVVSSSPDKFPLRTRNILSGEEGDMIFDFRDVLNPADKFVANSRESEAFHSAQHLLPTLLSRTGVTVTTCCRPQLDPGNALSNVDIGMTRGAGHEPETDYVGPRRFRQPVQSLTLDGNSFSVQKSTKNFWGHARSKHSFGHQWLFQQSLSQAHGAACKKRKLTFERDDASKSGQTKLKFI